MQYSKNGIRVRVDTTDSEAPIYYMRGSGRWQRSPYKISDIPTDMSILYVWQLIVGWLSESLEVYNEIKHGGAH